MPILLNYTDIQNAQNPFSSQSISQEPPINFFQDVPRTPNPSAAIVAISSQPNIEPFLNPIAQVQNSDKKPPAPPAA